MPSTDATLWEQPPNVIEEIMLHLHIPSDRLAFSCVCRATWACRQGLVGRAVRVLGAWAKSLPVFDQRPLRDLVDRFGAYIISSALHVRVAEAPWSLLCGMLRSTAAWSDPFILRLIYRTALRLPREHATFVPRLRSHVQAIAMNYRPHSTQRELESHRAWVSEMARILTDDSPITLMLWDAPVTRGCGGRAWDVTLSEDEMERYVARMAIVIERLAARSSYRSVRLTDRDCGVLYRIDERAFLRLVPPPTPVPQMRLSPRIIAMWPDELSIVPLALSMTAINWHDRTVSAGEYNELVWKVVSGAINERHGIEGAAVRAAVELCRQRTSPECPSYEALWSDRLMAFIELHAPAL